MNKIKNYFKNINWLYIIPFLVLSLIFLIIPFIITIISSFKHNEEATVGDIWSINGQLFIWEKIGVSLGVSIAIVVLVFVIGFPFGYFLSKTKSSTLKVINIILITAPLWLSTLIKLIGLKTIFDAMAGQPQGTYGEIFTILALVYNSLPVFILLIYNVMESFPNNLLNASKDLGRNKFDTFIYVLIPYTYQAILSGLFIVFITSLCSAGVSEFVNNSNDGAMIGGIILDIGNKAKNNDIALSTVSSLSLILCLLLVVLFLLFFYIPKKIKLFLRNKKINVVKG